MQEAMLEAAMMYAQKLGLSVIPLRGKIPMFENWPEIATREPAVIERWWHQHPNANIGIATGRKSDVFVVDIDPRHGGDESWEEQTMAHPAMPDTWQDITGGGGKHIFFRYPNFPVKSCAGILPGIDIRGDGGQVVVPPSVHPDTHKHYEWDGLRPIVEQPLAQAPDWLLDLLAPKADKKVLSELPLKIPHGVQHYTLLSLAGMLRRLGLSYAEILPTISAVNSLRCERPGPEKNIEQMVKSVIRYAPGDANLYSTATKLWRMTRAKEHEESEHLAGMKPVDAYSLMKRPPIQPTMVIEDCLHAGCTILAGPPKTGKSYLTLGLAIGVATGGKFVGARDIMQPGRVAYWALEESSHRTAHRLHQLVENPVIQLQNIEFMYDLKPMFSGGLEDIGLYCEKVRPSVIVIDTLMAFVTGDRGSRRDVFRDDYREIKALADIAHTFDSALIVVHHTNKIGGDGIQAVAGSHGLTAAADCVWTMTRQPNRRAVLQIQGREVEQQEFLMELELRQPIGWNVLEQGDDVQLSGERQIILEVLREGGPKSPKLLAAEIGKNPVTTRQLLFKMVKKGLVIRHSNGNYTISNESNRYSSQDDE